MSYFSKEIYQRKREYAYSVSNEGLEKIAIYLISENPKYKNVDLNDESVEKDEDDLRDEALELLYYGWNDIINKWSDSVRKWFKEINKKFDTDFPD